MGQSVSNLIARNMLGILDSQGVVVSTIMAQCGISRHVLEKMAGGCQRSSISDFSSSPGIIRR